MRSKLDRFEVGQIVDDLETGKLDQVRSRLPLHAQDMVYVAVETLEAGPLDAFVLLLDHGLDVDGVEGVTSLLAHAAGEGRADVVNLLLSRGASLKGVPLVAAVQGGNIDAVRMLLAAGAHVDRGNRGFPTPLKMARMMKRPDIEELLVEHGATELVGKGAAHSSEGE